MDFTIESRNGLLWVTITGEASLNNAVKIFQEAVDAAVQEGTNLILIDCSAMTGVLSGLDRYDLGSISAEYALQRSEGSIAFKVAVVGTPPVIDGFAALVASNRGVTTETFLDMSNAIEWLNPFARSVHSVLPRP
jgi:hypothetical protein